MTDKQATPVKPNGNTALADYGSRQDILELVGRLRTMLPGGDKLTDGQIKALAQAALAHRLDPLNGEIWMTDKGLMVGVKGLRRKGHEQVKGNYWTEFRTITDPAERKTLQIPDGALAFEARLFDSENLLTYSGTCERLLKAGIPWEAVERMLGSRPYTAGIGVFKAGEPSRMQPAQCGMKRAEADAIKRRFDISFDLPVEGEPVEDWVDVTAKQAHAPLESDMAQAPATESPAPPQPPTAVLDAAVIEADRKAANAKTKAALEQKDNF